MPPPLLFDFCEIVLMLLEKSVSTNGGFFSYDEIPWKRKYHKLTSKKTLVECNFSLSPGITFQKDLHFLLWWFFKTNLLQQTPWANYENHKFLNSFFLLKGICFFQGGKFPLQFLGAIPSRGFSNQKHRRRNLRPCELTCSLSTMIRRRRAFLWGKSWMVKWPFKGLTDLQLRNQKVTLNHLAEIFVCGRLPFFKSVFFFRKRGGSTLKLSRTGVFPLCRYVCPYIFADIIFVNKW